MAAQLVATETTGVTGMGLEVVTVARGTEAVDLETAAWEETEVKMAAEDMVVATSWWPTPKEAKLAGLKGGMDRWSTFCRSPSPQSSNQVQRSGLRPEAHD